MPLPIPDILENASNVLEAAKKVVDAAPEETLDISTLRLALQKVAPADILAVLNEVGKVYVGIHNIQITSIGCRPVPGNKTVELALQVEYGLGPRQLVLPMPFEMAKTIIGNFNDAFAIVQGNMVVANGGSGLIISLDPTKNGQ